MLCCWKKKRNGHVVKMKVRGQVVSMYRDVFLERPSVSQDNLSYTVQIVLIAKSSK